MLQANPIAFLAIVAVAMCWALAVVLYRVGTTGGVARMLALLLVAEGVTLISTGYIDLLLTPAVTASSWYPGWFRAEEIVHTLGDCAMLALYPPFLAAALQTKLTRPFAGKRMRIGITGASLVLFFTVLWSPIEIGGTLLYLMLVLLFGFALVASIHAWCVATAGIARVRARSFAVAFGFRDICWSIVYGGAIWMIWQGTYFVVDLDATGALYIIYALGTLLAVPLIAYGILRAHLFDIDLRIRWTIKQSTLATIFVTLIFLLSEGAERFLSAELGNFAGLLAAAVVVFFLAPLQRLAEGVASVAMPNTENTPAYASHRKMQVYEAALVEAQQEGGISEKERSLLNRVRDSLDISSADAATLENDLYARAAEIG